jgi:hypothetical protein
MLLSLAFGACALPQPASSLAAEPCRVGAPVVNVVETVKGVVDVGIDGHVWANDDYLNSLRVWRTGPNQFCAIEHSVGVFTTYAGPSPALTGEVPDGLRGVFTGTVTTRETGTFVPRYPTRGYIGTIDANCDREENCATFDYRWPNQYLSGFGRPVFESFKAAYVSPGHGRFVQDLDGSQGDILG